MKLHYELKCIDEDNGEVVAQISSYSEEGLMEEMGKRKWTDTISKYMWENERHEDYMKSPEIFGEKENEDNTAHIEDRPVNERLETEKFYESKEQL